MNRKYHDSLSLFFPPYSSVNIHRGSGMAKGFCLMIVLGLCIIAPSSWPGPEELLTTFDSPLLITSCGQNAEVHMVSVLAKRAGLDFVLMKTASSENLGGIRSLALILGASLKGMGAAGLDMNQEKQRIQQLLSEAMKRNIPLLCLHLGGEARRGPLSDELIIQFLPHAKIVIVTKPGNKDGFFNSLCDQHKIPLVEVERALDALEPLKKAFVSKE
jgi:hypothetical protein